MAAMLRSAFRPWNSKPHGSRRTGRKSALIFVSSASPKSTPHATLHPRRSIPRSNAMTVSSQRSSVAISMFAKCPCAKRRGIRTKTAAATNPSRSPRFEASQRKIAAAAAPNSIAAPIRAAVSRSTAPPKSLMFSAIQRLPSGGWSSYPQCSRMTGQVKDCGRKGPRTSPSSSARGRCRSARPSSGRGLRAVSAIAAATARKITAAAHARRPVSFVKGGAVIS